MKSGYPRFFKNTGSFYQFLYLRFGTSKSKYGTMVYYNWTANSIWTLKAAIEDPDLVEITEAEAVLIN